MSVRRFMTQPLPCDEKRAHRRRMIRSVLSALGCVFVCGCAAWYVHSRVGEEFIVRRRATLWLMLGCCFAFSLLSAQFILRLASIQVSFKLIWCFVVMLVCLSWALTPQIFSPYYVRGVTFYDHSMIFTITFATMLLMAVSVIANSARKP